MKVAILNTSLTDVERVVNARTVTFRVGEYGFDVAGIRCSGELSKMDDAERKAIGAPRISEISFNQKRETFTRTGYKKTQSGKLSFSGSMIVEEGTVSSKQAGPERDALRRSVDSMKAGVQSGGLVFTHSGVDYAVQTSEDSRNMLNGAVSMAQLGAWADTDFWTVREIVTVEGVDYLGASVDLAMTAAEITALGVVVGDHMKIAHGAARFHKAQIDALPDTVTFADLDAYDMSVGWPPNAPTEEAPTV